MLAVESWDGSSWTEIAELMRLQDTNGGGAGTTTAGFNFWR